MGALLGDQPSTIAKGANAFTFISNAIITQKPGLPETCRLEALEPLLRLQDFQKTSWENLINSYFVFSSIMIKS